MADREYELHLIKKRAQIVSWLVVVSYWMMVAYAYIVSLPAEAFRFFWWVYGVGSLPIFITSLILLRSQRLIWRLLVPILAVVPGLIETLVFSPFLGPNIWWACFVVGYGGIMLFTWKEWRAVLLMVGLVVGMGLVVAFLHPHVRHLPPNLLTHGTIRYVLVLPALGAAIVIGTIYNKSLRERLSIREKQLEELLQTQSELAQQLALRGEEAEKRRIEVEKALSEIARMREIEAARAEREAFLMRYERLMRTGYGLSEDEFAQALLDMLSTDISLLGGLFYTKENGGWKVIAAYAFPSKIGQEAKGGPLRIAETLQKPYLLEPAPPTVPISGSLLVQPKPTGILYLPFYSDASKKVVAVAELLLAKKVEPSHIALLEEILPRIGTYWGERQRIKASAASPEK
ncbi:MAG: hypothetical protein N2253_00025 [Bacteroidia bacterium]|nr:hypothetical protein [Bacteroidia bacterium]